MPLFPNQDLRNVDYKNLEAGDETHRYGDYVPYGIADGSSLEVGDLVTAGTDEEVDAFSASDGDTLFGVYYSAKFEGAVATGPDRDAEIDESQGVGVKTSGTVIARLEDSQFATGVSTDVTIGEPLGGNGRGIVLHLSDEDPDNAGTYYAEILL